MIRVGVVRGGVSREYDLSLKTGGSVLQILREHFPSSYKAIDILITKDGIWHIAGRPISSDELVSSVDVVWNGLHGEYGEDGALQAQLEALNIPTLVQVLLRLHSVPTRNLSKKKSVSLVCILARNISSKIFAN